MVLLVLFGDVLLVCVFMIFVHSFQFGLQIYFLNFLCFIVYFMVVLSVIFCFCRIFSPLTVADQHLRPL